MPVFDPGGYDPTSYVTVEELKRALGGISDNLDDDDLNRAALAASRMVDTYCNRFFYKTTSATVRKIEVENLIVLHVPDIADTAGLVVQSDENGDGTFEATWAATDYQTEPLSALTQPVGQPITQIRGITRFFPLDWRSRARVQVTAVWGWPAVPAEITQATLTLANLLFRRKDAPLGITGNVDTGVARLSNLMKDQHIIPMIAPFRKLMVG